MKSKILFIIFLICTALNSKASVIKDIYFNLGTHTEFFNAIQTDDKGTLRKFDFAPTVGAGITIPMREQVYFAPEFNWVLPQMIEESKIMVNTLMFRADIAYDPLPWLRTRLGTSLMWQNQQGKGGSAKLNNGTSQSTFYYPDENKSSLNNTLDLGVEGMYENFSLRLQTYTYSVFKSDRRQISYTLFLTYYWEQK